MNPLTIRNNMRDLTSKQLRRKNNPRRANLRCQKNRKEIKILLS